MSGTCPLPSVPSEDNRFLSQRLQEIQAHVFIGADGAECTGCIRCYVSDRTNAAFLHAVKQIDQTITTFKQGGYFRTTTINKVIAAIVFSHFPSNNSSYRSAWLKLRKNHKELKVKELCHAKSLTYDPL